MRLSLHESNLAWKTHEKGSTEMGILALFIQTKYMMYKFTRSLCDVLPSAAVLSIFLGADSVYSCSMHVGTEQVPRVTHE